MRDAHRTGHILAFAEGLQVGDLAFGFIDIQLTVGADERYAGAVVTAVFQPLETLYKNRIGFRRSQVAHNSTHIKFVL